MLKSVAIFVRQKKLSRTQKNKLAQGLMLKPGGLGN